jgi:transcriptional regulator with XRE-family HTH domain
MNRTSPALSETLREARKMRRMSQLELSMRVGVSQRHMSFVESGRSNPSRELLMAWLQELEAPLAVRNAAMIQAGYAPAYSAAPLGDPALAQASAAMSQLLQAHDPMPALLLDADWNLLRRRLGAARLHAGWAPPMAPVLTTRFATVHGELAFFSMFTTFGTPQDITLASLRVEHMFAADDATRAVIRSQVS